ncbi:MAG: MvaI/BcnI family restriction endonuclease [Deltaproteobacteria bacterium]
MPRRIIPLTDIQVKNAKPKVPSNCGKEPELAYRYGNLIRIGYGTDFTLCLKALALGKVDYDPGIKLENASTKPKVKHRSQFRIKSDDIELLYHKMKMVDLTEVKAVIVHN